MSSLINIFFDRSRTVLSLLALILISGTIAYVTIPKEAEPDVAIPIIYVSMHHEGISPEDAERLLVRPMEKELQTIEGVKEMQSSAEESHASVLLEFDAGFDSDKALQDVREKVDMAKTELPADTDEPSVNEVNVALFPVLVVTLAGEVPERTLLSLARGLKDKIEGLRAVLEADIAGDREEVVEIVVEPRVLDSYGISYEELTNFVWRNNKLVAAGALDTGQGRFALKVPGLLEGAEDVLSLPVKVVGDRVVTFADVATVRRTFKDPTSFARVGGRPAISLEISKRVGENIIETIDQVRAIVEEERATWPEGVTVSYSQDKSKYVKTMLSDLQNNVISAVLLVMVVIVAALGLRTAGLVGLAIPGSFLTGILIIYIMGLTINIVVLFSLIMAVGMLIDGAIVVTELADRKMAEGLSRREAYAFAAQRMAWPIIASTATTLAAFMPLLFWPGVVGEFMKFLPITLLATLTASLAMALIFVPTLGQLVGRVSPLGEDSLRSLAASEKGELHEIRGLTGLYLRLLERLLAHPLKILMLAMLLLVVVYSAYAIYGKGVEFFPSVEPEQAIINVRARGNLSVYEQDAMVRRVEKRVLQMPEIESVYSRSGIDLRGQELPADTVGVIQMEFVNWQQRRPASAILAEIRERTADIAGIIIELRKQEGGPPVGKPVQLQLGSRYPQLLAPAVVKVRELLDEVGGFVDVVDDRPLPGIEWQLSVDRTQAARFGADITVVGNAVQMVTNGIKVSDYRPDDADDEVDIIVRLPEEARKLDQLERLRVQTNYGLVPISNFVSRAPAPKLGTIKRVDGQRVMTVKADVEEGLLPANKVSEIQQWLDENVQLDPRLTLTFKGEDEEQRESRTFLSKAFGMALFIMAIILVTQFNSFYQAFLILTAVIFSTVGVMLGLLTTGQPFGIVMSGVGVIALAGIVVNNNIVLIDTYNILRKGGMEATEAVLRTAAQRLRPVLLTTLTTILGLMPMVLMLNIDLVNRELSSGAPSTQWWVQLSTGIAGGLTFATLLTLVLTPCLLMLGETMGQRWRRGERG
ncbi:MAG: efflux RND transporter permease subunit [Gammaproteobacteria bacterium]|nr:efflux RND transporter permease subunit [Gammaproteobacteria bacterium]MCW8973209.1 efflux RND transporter permease subunit [Gammaproteobacteria bacterium]MCW8993954.1 efflux RND transporter permease subunit [Gammaproteobacteria bacterium]